MSLFALGFVAKGYQVACVSSDPVLSKNSQSLNQTLDLCLQFFKSQKENYDSYMFTCKQLLKNWEEYNQLRFELGFRSCLHTLEKMITPQNEGILFLGISHKAYAKRMLKALVTQNVEAQIILGNHGTIDFLFHKPTVVCQLKQGEVVEKTVDPSLLDLKLPTSLYSLTAFNDWENELQKVKSSLWQAIYFQAAGMLYLSGKYNDLISAWEEIIK